MTSISTPNGTPTADRRRRLRARMAESSSGVDAVLVTRLLNARYLTGFTGSNAAVLLTPDGDYLATDGRYTAQAAAQAPDVERIIDRGVGTALVRHAARSGVRRLGFEPHEVTVEVYDALRDAAPEVELVRLPADARVERLRMVKDEAEISLLREACAIADRAFADLLEAGSLVGRSERDVAVDLEARMRAHGSDGPSFETIVATGPNSAIPHHRPTDRTVERGDLLKFDFGALYKGYHSDMTRTVGIGTLADWQREIYDLVATAQRLGREALTVGADVREIDKVARDVIVAAGHGDDYPHGLGHGVGLEIHEAPTLGYGATGTLEESVPVTVEPGVYLPGRGGVRIEDTLVVRPAESGGPDLLTTTTKDLLVL